MTEGTQQRLDAIIVGGGLAGIHLALAMDWRGLRALVVDRPDPISASRIAAGIINPITGRRFALTWMYENLLPVFTEVYQYWETRWNTRFFYPKNIYRSVPQNKLVNDLDAKLTDPKYSPYCRQMTGDELENIERQIQFEGPGYVMHGFQLDTCRFIDHAFRYLRSRGMYVEGHIEGKEDHLGANNFEYGPYKSERLVWATGAAIVKNPLFSWIRMNPNKGEILIVEVQDLPGADIIKQSAFYVPLENKRWIGTFDTWDTDDEHPTPEGKEYLLSRIQAFKKPVTVVDHLAAIRPAVYDRRPVIGSHPQNMRISLFNGFGSKGTSLIPYFAQMLVDHMMEGRPILKEVDVMRYWEE